jgi:hypothetical protein
MHAADHSARCKTQSQPALWRVLPGLGPQQLPNRPLPSRIPPPLGLGPRADGKDVLRFVFDLDIPLVQGRVPFHRWGAWLAWFVCVLAGARDLSHVRGHCVLGVSTHPPRPPSPKPRVPWQDHV